MNDELTPDSTVKNQSPFIAILRWIAVLPAAVSAYFGIQLLLILLNSLTEDGWSDWGLQLINSATSSYCFVYAGAVTAPTRRFIVGVVLAILLGVFVVAVTTAGFFVEASEPLWWLALAGIISLIAAIVATVKIREEFQVS